MKKPKPAPYRERRFGIINHLGDVWTPVTFGSEEAGKRYLAEESHANPTWKLGRHRVVRVRVTISAIAARS